MRWALALFLLMCMGCEHPWTPVNSALEAAAVATARTDELVAQAMIPDHEAARAQVIEQASQAIQTWEACESDCGPRPTLEEFMERYRSQVERWERVTLALSELREVLITAQATVIVWRDTKTQPGNWGAICTGLDTARGAVVRAVEAAGVDVPDQYEDMLQYLQPVCNLAVDVIAGD